MANYLKNSKALKKVEKTESSKKKKIYKKVIKPRKY